MSVQLDAAFNYNDLQGLDTLKQGARNDDPKALKAVAQQFESMFIGMIMKSMRDATDVLSSDLESSYQTKFYRDMYDQQLSLSVSQQGGFGLADVLYEQISRSQQSATTDLTSIQVKQLEDSIRPILPSTQSKPFVEAAPLSQIETPTNTLSDSLPDKNVSMFEPAKTTGKGAVFSTPEDFINRLLPIAEKAAEAIGVEPKILVAQAALETGWGKFVIKSDDGSSSNNLFGIKADQRWQGESAMTTTHEFIGGKRLMVKEPFRAYESLEASFNDYVAFVSGSARYHSAVESAGKGEDYLNKLQQAGYATDPNYAEKIIRIANSELFGTA